MPFAQDQAVWFPQWAEALAQLRLPALHREQYRQALIRYLRYCKETRQPATIAAARAFIASVQTQGLLGVAALALWKDALNWFFREGRKPQASGTRSVCQTLSLIPAFSPRRRRIVLHLTAIRATGFAGWSFRVGKRC